MSGAVEGLGHPRHDGLGSRAREPSGSLNQSGVDDLEPLTRP
ncbi:hypothetical protein [Streptomyces sp. BPTC-684]|nr:hypothetical protein [Streptomyces sp. BPTC-684]WHM36159.1 hypothetical protein QIY60_03915 [Streptomyces sp. BPTC-684]